MKPLLQEVTVECADAARLAEFWGNVLSSPWGYQVEPGGVVYGGTFYMLFQEVPPESLSAGNRLHLDIEVDDIEKAASEAESLGATRTGEQFADPDGGGFITMRDLEHNAFCFVSQPCGTWSELLRAVAVQQPTATN